MGPRGDENAASSSSDGLGKYRAARELHLVKKQDRKEKNENP